MRRSRIPHALLAIPLAMALPACAGFKQDLPTPEAGVERIEPRDLGLDGISIFIATWVENPYGMDLPVTAIDYQLRTPEAVIVEGAATLQERVGASRRITIPTTARVRFADLLAVLPDVRPGGIVHYEASVRITVQTPVLGDMQLQADSVGQLPVPVMPKITATELRWDGLSITSARGTLDLRVTNPNRFPITVQRLGYRATLAGLTVADTDLAGPVRLGADEVHDFSIGFELGPAALGSGAYELLSRGGIEYGVEGAMDLTTDFGPLVVPVSAKGTVAAH